MTYSILDTIVAQFTAVFGSYTMMALVIIGFFLMLLLAIKASRAVILMILAPIIFVLASNGISQYIGISGAYTWIAIGVWVAIGIVFASVFYFVTQ